MRARTQGVDETGRHTGRGIDDHALKFGLYGIAMKDASEVVANIVVNIANQPLERESNFVIGKFMCTRNDARGSNRRANLVTVREDLFASDTAANQRNGMFRSSLSASYREEASKMSMPGNLDRSPIRVRHERLQNKQQD